MRIYEPKRRDIRERELTRIKELMRENKQPEIDLSEYHLVYDGCVFYPLYRTVVRDFHCEDGDVLVSSGANMGMFVFGSNGCLVGLKKR